MTIQPAIESPTQQSVVHSTFVIERSFPKPQERVFAAFADPAIKRRWWAESHRHEVEEFTQDFRVGGIERLRYRFGEGSPLPAGTTITNEELYQDIVPNQLIVTASKMTLGDKCISVALATIEFLPTGTGTDLICTYQGAFFENSGGPEMREAGWRGLLEKLGKELAK